MIRSMWWLALGLLAGGVAQAAPDWRGDQVYRAGDTVTVAGVDYRAQWWTQGQDPASHAGGLGSGQPWLVLDPAQPPLACGDVWRADRAYAGNAVVSRHGRNYLANWWTQGHDPQPAAGREVWRDVGPCDYLADYAFTMTSQRVQPLAFKGDTLSAAYRIHVSLPPGFQPDTAYPVLYVLDWSLIGALVTAQYQALRDAGRVVPLIVVGIACPDSDFACEARRSRDFSPTYWPLEEAYLGNDDPELRISGGGPAFLAFLRDELIPRIETRYLSDAAARGLHGTSMSGLFASYALVAGGNTFGRYLINSPSLWYDDNSLVTRAQLAPAADFAGVQRAFFSMGADEGEPYLSDTAVFAALIGAKGVPVAEQVFPGMDHGHAPLVATEAGLLDSYPR
ncbi:carbohydrate-binding protein [Chitiniphilus shinanonensis]|uniref:carbohydrate-binding protein n=1 Tax=Chitiniphilus shinanonensis TaxID=553088 RepID=UPI0030328D3D